MSLRDVWDLSAPEWSVWLAYYQRHGFPDDRAEWGRAAAGAYVGACWGGKARPADLIPQFEPMDPAAKRARIRAWLESITAPKRPAEPEGAAGGR